MGLDPGRGLPVDLAKLVEDLLAKTEVLHGHEVELKADHCLLNVDGPRSNA